MVVVKNNIILLTDLGLTGFHSHPFFSQTFAATFRRFISKTEKFNGLASRNAGYRLSKKWAFPAGKCSGLSSEPCPLNLIFAPHLIKICFGLILVANCAWAMQIRK